MNDAVFLRCRLCRERPVADAVEVWTPGGWVVRFGCLPCLQREALRSARKLAARLRLPSAAVVASRGLALRWISPTVWLREGLQAQGATLEEFQARQAGRLHATHHGDAARRTEVAQAIVVLLRAVAQADGVTSPLEWQAMRRALFLMHREDEEVWRALDPGAEPRPAPTAAELADAVARLRRVLRPFDAPLLLTLFAQVADAVGGRGVAEARRVHALGSELGLAAEQVHAWFGAPPHAGGGASHKGAADAGGGHAPPPDADPHAILGVDAGASRAEIRRAYLKLAMEHHPDRVAQHGPAMLEAANERMKQINAAYAVLRQG